MSIAVQNLTTQWKCENCGRWNASPVDLAAQLLRLGELDLRQWVVQSAQGMQVGIVHDSRSQKPNRSRLSRLRLPIAAQLTLQDGATIRDGPANCCCKHRSMRPTLRRYLVSRKGPRDHRSGFAGSTATQTSSGILTCNSHAGHTALPQTSAC
jgi:hypothetical protein